MSTVNDVLIVAAEASSELYASRIMEECKSRNLPIKFFGIGSRRMQSLGLDVIELSEKMAVVGIWEVLAHWGVISRAFKNLHTQAKKKKPRFAILLDYPDFNLRLAKKLNALNIPVFYYISPQVWAWRTGRVNLIKKIIKKMLVVFPFEVDFYKNHGVDVSFVGHPLLDEITDNILSEKDRLEKRSKMNIKPQEFFVGLLPGSRASELKNNFLSQLRAAEIIFKKAPQTKFMILVAPTLDIDFVKSFIPQNFSLNYMVVKDEPLKMIQLCDACMVASGTATLVTALAQTPMVIMYKMNGLTARLAERLVRGKFFGMPNLIFGEKTVPELFQDKANPESLASEIIKYIENGNYYTAVKNKLGTIKEKLGSQGANKRVVDEFQRELSR